jgi:hypothetical protein
LIDIAAGRLAGRRVGPAQDVTIADMNVHFLAPIVDGPAGGSDGGAPACASR